MVAVGMPVTRHPPHRYQRAALPHWAPGSGLYAYALIRIRLHNPRFRAPFLGDTLHVSHVIRCLWLLLRRTRNQARITST